MLSDKPRYQVGDWLRWLRQDGLQIGVVEYARDSKTSSFGVEYVTNVGTVQERDVLEARRPAELDMGSSR